MKRLISILLTLSLLVSVLAFPVSAASSDHSIFINLLDYCFPNNGSSNTVYYHPGTVVYFEPDIVNNYHYIDFVFFSSEVPYYVNIKTQDGWYNLQVYNIGDQMYRAFGKFDENIQTQIYLEFGTSAFTYLTFYNLHVGTMQHNYTGETAQLNVVVEGYNNSGSMSAPNSPVTLPLPAPSGTASSIYDYNALINKNEWYKYDYMEFFLDIRCVTIDSIFCRIGTIDVPYTTNYFNGTVPEYYENPNDNNTNLDPASNLRYILIRVDLTNIDHSLTGPLSIGINGTVSTFTSSQFIALFSVNGILDVSLDNPFIFNIKKLFDSINAGFSNSINNMVNGFGQVLTKLDQLLGNDTSAGDEFQDQIATESDKMNDINDAMESVTQPTIGDIHIQDDPLMDNSQLQGDVTSWAGHIFESYFFQRIFLMIVILATARFVLFGKE